MTVSYTHLRQADPVHYVVCNGDEGDPGAFMDGSVMEGDPYRYKPHNEQDQPGVLPESISDVYKRQE